MSQASDKVVAGFVRLTDEERQAVIVEVNNVQSATGLTRRVLEEKICNRSGVPLGPTDQGRCPCCGR
jgi:hypothetical protein